MSWVPRIDTQFGDYRIEMLIGHGGMSVVYRAEHISLGRKVALKILSPALTEQTDFQERFVRESRMAAALDHQNIIPIYEAGDVDGVYFIAMRYVDGHDLKHLIKQEGPLDARRTSSIITQVASALAIAHDEGLVHRDVKPANVLLSARRPGEDHDHVYLSDFGVAKQTASDVALTRTGLFVGTADYAAPEQIEGKPLDGRTDVYALGCVLFECLTAEMPYEKDSEVASMYAHLLEPPPRITEKRPDLPAAVNDLISKAMAKSKDDRYPSVREFAAAVREELERAPERPVAAAGQTEVEPGPAARETVLAATPAEAPPATPPTTVAAPPSAEEPSGPGFFDRYRNWLVPVLLLLVGAGVSAGVVLAVTGGDDENGAVGQTQTTTPTTQQPQGDTRQLASLVPNPVWKECAVKAVPSENAIQSAVCLGGTSGGDGFTPDRTELSIYPNANTLRAAYGAERKRANVGSDFGRCTGTGWGGEGAWTHGPDKPGGHRFCYFDGNDAVIVWTHEKLGQETHAEMLAISREGGSAHDGLFNWWRFWHHRIGKLAE